MAANVSRVRKSWTFGNLPKERNVLFLEMGT